MARKGFTDADVPDQAGRVFFVTGANTGLGYEASRTVPNVVVDGAAKSHLYCSPAAR